MLIIGCRPVSKAVYTWRFIAVGTRSHFATRQTHCLKTFGQSRDTSDGRCQQRQLLSAAVCICLSLISASVWTITVSHRLLTTLQAPTNSVVSIVLFATLLTLDRTRQWRIDSTATFLLCFPCYGSYSGKASLNNRTSSDGDGAIVYFISPQYKNNIKKDMWKEMWNQ